MGLQRRPDDNHQLHQRNRTPDLEHGHRNAEGEEEEEEEEAEEEEGEDPCLNSKHQILVYKTLAGNGNN